MCSYGEQAGSDGRNESCDASWGRARVQNLNFIIGYVITTLNFTLAFNYVVLEDYSQVKK